MDFDNHPGSAGRSAISTSIVVLDLDLRIALVLLGEGERRQWLGSGSPARKGQLDAAAICGEADH
ncbi:hypothetical protein QCM77_04125 [Bradyrhizobium sp. SSUT18]|uniref:hypothetical protein n=1 Tax=unclassified Bradyrhizobium TaxID=2631580 RepID=UPI00244B6E9B|nr:hypothetical protein [Bradyrhizobium sp. SSUT18]MDH2399145.1 hypothetical protein [Bradyrhizobium sp. SSUT18]